MKKIAINNKVVEVYDSIDELPIVNFQKYNKYLLIDSGVGSDIDAIDDHVVKLAKLIKKGDEQKAMQELLNMRQCLYMINSQISPKYLAFAALVYKIDGEEVKDLSDDGLKDVLAKINEVKHNKILEFLLGFKKKIQEELEIYFPEDFAGIKEKEIMDLLKARTLYIFDGISHDIDNSEKIKKVDERIFSKYKPQIFAGENSVEVKHDKQFEAACLYLAQKANLNAKMMTVFEFYNAMSIIRKQAEAEAKSIKNNRRK